MEQISKGLDVLGKRFGALENKVDDIRDWQNRMEGRDYGEQIGQLRQDVAKNDAQHRADLKAERSRCEAKEVELETRIKTLENHIQRTEGRGMVYKAIANNMPWLFPLGLTIFGYFIWLQNR